MYQALLSSLLTQYKHNKSLKRRKWSKRRKRKWKKRNRESRHKKLFQKYNNLPTLLAHSNLLSNLRFLCLSHQTQERNQARKTLAKRTCKKLLNQTKAIVHLVVLELHQHNKWTRTFHLHPVILLRAIMCLKHRLTATQSIKINLMKRKRRQKTQLHLHHCINSIATYLKKTSNKI